MSVQTADYILGHPENELDPLGILSRAFQPFTRQLFANAGLKEGMRRATPTILRPWPSKAAFAATWAARG